MTDDPIAQPVAPLDSGEAQRFPHDWSGSPEHALPEPESREDRAELREEGRAQAKDWLVTGRRRFSPELEKRRQKAVRVIFGNPLKMVIAERKAPTASAQLVANNQRLLRSTSLDIRNALRAKVTFPQVRLETNPAELLPRAYFAAKAYLAASHFAFDESAFVEFMHGAQEAAYFEIAEIWLLKQMLQLVLLERFADQTGDATLADSAAPVNGQPPEPSPVDMTSLIESFRKLSDYDFKAVF